MPGAVGLRLLDGRADGGDVVPVDPRLHVPAVSLEPLGRVVGEPALGLAVDRDAVVVVADDELAQAQRAGERCGLVRDAFHQAAVADEDIRPMVDDGVVRPVENGGEQSLGKRHPDRVRETLAERSGRRLDAGRDAVFGVAGRLGVELAEALELFDRQVVAGQVEERV